MEKEVNQLLKKLYNGEICPKSEFPRTQEFINLNKKRNKLSNELLKGLDETKKKIFYRYTENEAHLSSLDSENQFLLGFKIATKLIYEGLNREEEQKE